MIAPMQTAAITIASITSMPMSGALPPNMRTTAGIQTSVLKTADA
jgi:hypothetical protein